MTLRVQCDFDKKLIAANGRPVRVLIGPQDEEITKHFCSTACHAGWAVSEMGREAKRLYTIVENERLEAEGAPTGDDSDPFMTHGSDMSSRPILVDYCCGAGGASAGYTRAGFTVIGVDNQPQPRYPYRFIHADVRSFDPTPYRPAVVVGSPPCQAYTVLNSLHSGRSYVDLIPHVRLVFQQLGLPYVIENVPQAPLINPLTLCGTMFSEQLYVDIRGRRYHLRKHRLFESNVTLTAPRDCDDCSGKGVRWIGGVYGHGTTRNGRQL